MATTVQSRRTMKAVVNTAYGTPEVLKIQQIARPVPKLNEVLIRVQATTVNRTDCGLRKAEPFIVRLFMGVFKPRIQVLGSEFAGEIVEVGSQVTAFKSGDRVFGLSYNKYGAHAEFLCLPEQEAFTLMPEKCSFNEAAAICEGATLAYMYLKACHIEADQQLLVYGASGSIGTAAVQLAHAFGVDVTAVCNTKNLELVKSLGADRVIDYQTTDFTQLGKQYDIVFDAVGKSTLAECRPLLKEGGIYMSTDLGPYAQNPFLHLWTTWFGRYRVLFPVPRQRKEDIERFKALVEERKYKPVIDRVYSIDQIASAYQYVETETKTGNVVITVP